MFDIMKAGVVKSSVLKYTRNFKRGCQDVDAYCVGAMQTSNNVVDSAPFFIANGHKFWFSFSTSF